MKSIRLPRRTVLRGAGGVVLGLPVLEAMLDARGRAFGQTGAPPKRYIVMYGGTSLGSDTDRIGPSRFHLPGTEGPNYEITGKLALDPLVGIKDKVSVVSNLRIPAKAIGTFPDPGGWSGNGFHGTASWVQFSGSRSAPSNGSPVAPTSDHFAAQAIEKIVNGQRQRPLSLCAQPATYDSFNNNSTGFGTMSCVLNSDSKLTKNYAVFSPQLLWGKLFRDLPATTGATQPDPRLAADRRLRKSIADAVLARSRELMKRLSKADQLRLKQHLEEVDSFDKALAGAAPAAPRGCVRPADPGADPPIGTAINPNKCTSLTCIDYTAGAGWSDEDKRADLFCDYVSLAFKMDSFRVVAFMVSYIQSFMNLYASLGFQGAGPHACTHFSKNSSTQNNAKVVAWHVKYFAKLIRLLSSLDCGGTILDNTAIVLMFEGGFGWGPDMDTPNSEAKKYGWTAIAHSTENMMCLVAGGGLRGGYHINAAGKHPANVLVSAMDAVGTFAGGKPKKLGDVEGGIAELSPASR